MQFTEIKGTRYHFIAVDFDGTLCDSNFPDCGSPRPRLMARLHKRREKCTKMGLKPIIILWTCRSGDALEKAVRWCKMWDVPIDFVNTNPIACGEWGLPEKKIYADEYWDDKAVIAR